MKKIMIFNIKQVLLLRILIVLGIIAVNGGFIEATIKESDSSYLIIAGMVTVTLIILLCITTKVSDEENQETMKDLFKKQSTLILGL